MNSRRSREYLNMQLNRAKDLKRNKQYAQAEAILQDALKEFPDNSRITASLADLYYRKGAIREAMELAVQVLARDSVNTEACIVMGNVYISMQNYEKAVEYFGGALNSVYSDYVICRIAHCKYELGFVEESLALLDKALDSNSENTWILREKAKILSRLGKIREAGETYEKLSRLDPNDKFAYKEMLRLKGKSKDPEEMTTTLNTILKLPGQKDNPHLLSLKANSLKSQGRFDEAVEAFKTGLKLRPDDPYMMKMLGYCYKKMNKTEEAMESLLRSLYHEPGDEILRNNLYYYSKKIGRISDYKNMLEKILKEKPGQGWIYGMLKKIEKNQ